MVKVRVAFGTEILLGLREGRLEVAPTTAHFLTYFTGRCTAGCSFCPQGKRSSADVNMLSRVLWPSHEVEEVVRALRNKDFERVCIQAVNFPGFLEDVLTLVKKIKDVSDAPISVSSPPLKKVEMEKLRAAGVERLCIPLDATTEEIFRRTKEGYRWEEHLSSLLLATGVFPGVTTHLIIGLGETEEEAVKLIQLLTDEKITVGLFAFTPVKGTPMENWKPPVMESYRRIQLASHLIQHGLTRGEKMKFGGGRILDFSLPPERLSEIVDSGTPFVTSGCPRCNRPFYNEPPRGPMYNYPRPPAGEELQEIKRLLQLL